MNGSSFRRLRRYGRTRSGRGLLVASGVASPLLLPGLIAVLGLLVHLRIEGRAPSPDLFLGPLTQPGQWLLDGDQYASLLKLIALGLALAVAETFLLLFAARQVQRVALATAAELKSAIHSQAFQLGASELLGGRRLRPEELFTDQTEVVRRGLTIWYRVVPRAAVALVVLAATSFAASASLTVFAVLLAVSLWLIYRWLRQRSQEEASLWEDRARVQHDTLLDDLRLSPLAAGYALDRAQNEPFEEGLRQYERSMLRARMNLASVGPLVMLMTLTAAAILALVVGLSEIRFAPLVVVAASLSTAAFPLSLLYRLRKTMPEAEAAASEILAYLERRPSVRESDAAQPLSPPLINIQLDVVTLADRGGRRLLDEISLTLEAGRRIGVVASDSGTPAALGGLFIRLYDPAAGRVLFNGTDVRQATLESLRGLAAMVSPTGMLFTASVTENITCGEARFDQEQVHNAARQARSYDFIQQLPQGFDSTVGQHGMRLDEGQAFRIALARALIRDPALLVIEEPHEPYNGPDAALIDEALSEAAADRTVIFLPARLATLRSLDRIYLLHDGKLFAEGAHADLIRQCDLYRHLHYVEFNPFRETLNERGRT